MRPLACAFASLFFAAAALAEDCPPLRMMASVDLIPSASGRVEHVPVEIAGQPKLLLLDLGAEVSMLNNKVAEELQLKTFHSNVELYSLTGAKTDRYTPVEVKLGGMKGNLKLMVAPYLDDMSENSQVVGLLGADVLSNFDVAIDFGANKLDLLDKNHCDGKVVYWPTTVVAVVPFKTWHIGQIVFDVTLDGKTVKAILDTGAWQSTLRLNTAERLYDVKPGTPDTPEIGGLNERDDLKTYNHVFKTLDFNGIAVTNPNFNLIPDMISKKLAPGAPTGSHLAERDDALEAPILLGMNVLKHLHIYIAYKEQKLYITPAAKPAPAAAAAAAAP